LKNTVKLLTVIIIFSISAQINAADNPLTIITDSQVFIHRLNYSQLSAFFSELPDIKNRHPVKTVISKDRFYIILPETVINITNSGQADEKTLISLYLSRQLKKEGIYAGEKIISTNGFMYFFKENKLFRINMNSGYKESYVWNTDPPEKIYPACGDNLIFPAEKNSLAVFDTVEKQIKIISPNTGVYKENSTFYTAVSEEYPLTAVKEFRSGTVVIYNIYNGKHKKITIPENTGSTMTWAGKNLVFGNKGNFIILNTEPEDLEQIKIYKYSSPAIPSAWYTLSGYGNCAALFSPFREETELFYYNSRTPENTQSGRTPGMEINSFHNLVKYRSETAGKIMETAGAASAAAFYSWLLEFIEEYRSENPLDFAWADLEKNIRQKRYELHACINQ